MKKAALIKKNGRLRVYILLAVFAVFFAVIAFRAFQLQALEGGKLGRMAANQHNRTVSVPSRRGEIFDRNLKELAVSLDVDSVYAEPGRIESPKAASRALAAALSMDAREIEKRLGSGRGFVWLKRQIDLGDDQRRKVAAIEGIGITKEARRFYPNRQLASNLIGFIGKDSNGLEGIELYYDNFLKGVSYRLTGEKDAAGKTLMYEDVNKQASIRGMEIELTIDKTIQYIAEKSLARAVEAYGAKGGSAIVMNPSTGELLAMATLPTYDPNNFNSFMPREWRNRAVTDAFEPGSVVKLFLISAALEENATRPEEIFFCENGSYRVADRTFHDVEKYGWLTTSQILKYSSNIGAAKIGERLGKQRLHRYLKSFGFGEKTGVDLPGESAGSFMNYKKWSGVTIDTVSFGQGISATGIQLVTALSAVANGGFVMKPYVVRRVADSKGAVVAETNPSIVRRVISEKTARKMTELLVGVTNSGGTGTRAALDGFEVAGKTGTAQKADLKKGGYHESAYVATFMGFVPAKAPKLAILVMIDEPKKEHHGGVVAAPVFKEIASESLSYMGVYPEGPGGVKAPMVQYVSAVSQSQLQAREGRRGAYAGTKEDDAAIGGVPDFTGKTVRSVLNAAKERSLEVSIIGSGRAVAQRPSPGRGVPRNIPVVVWFQ